MSAPGNLLTEWARVLAGALVHAGVRRVVASPGSRSTPFLWAMLERPELELRTIADERSAAFFALGQSKLTGDASALLCTSGSAPANYLPAIVEASESHAPLVVVTADRPPALHDAGAAQTIDQTRLYGAFARASLELGPPQASGLAALARRVVGAVERARGPLPGPVQINAPADKPLEPRAARTPPEQALSEHADRVLDCLPELGRPRATLDADAILRIADDCARAERGLVVCGPLSPASPRVQAVALARALGFPLIAEATSQARLALDQVDAEVICDAADEILSGPERRADLAPEVIVQLGGFPVSGTWERYLAAHPAARLHVIVPAGCADPHSRACSLTHAPVAEAAEALRRALRPRGPTAWQRRFAEHNAAAWRRLEEQLANDRGEAAMVRAAVDRLPPGSLLALGNSLPVREVDRFCPARAADISVLSQRGAAGIDGSISLAAGAASVAERPTLLLLGDVAFLHDVGGLWAARGCRVPLAIVVLNNGGGRIFEQLPIAEQLGGDPRWSHWSTPHAFDLSHAAALYEHPFRRAESAAELGDAVAWALERRGASVIEARVGGGA